MQEVVFSRKAYDKSGGIPDFPLAWAADDAFIAKMGAEHPIKTISGCRVSWRQSGLNISSHISPSTSTKKIAASKMMVKWGIAFLAAHPPSFGPLSPAELQRMTSKWFFCRLDWERMHLNLATSLQIDRFAQKNWDWTCGKGLITCARLNYALLKGRWQARSRMLT